MMRLTKEQLIENLKLLGLVGLENDKPISYSGFKNRASIHKYGKKNKIVFVGHPKQNLFGFYVLFDNDTNAMKEAYRMFCKLASGNMVDYNYDNIQWGNAGIPLGYGDLRQIEYH
jgi:hypothetical protein